MNNVEENNSYTPAQHEERTHENDQRSILGRIRSANNAITFILINDAIEDYRHPYHHPLEEAHRFQTYGIPIALIAVSVNTVANSYFRDSIPPSSFLTWIPLFILTKIAGASLVEHGDYLSEERNYFIFKLTLLFTLCLGSQAIIRRNHGR